MKPSFGDLHSLNVQVATVDIWLKEGSQGLRENSFSRPHLKRSHVDRCTVLFEEHREIGGRGRQDRRSGFCVLDFRTLYHNTRAYRERAHLRVLLPFVLRNTQLLCLMGSEKSQLFLTCWLSPAQIS